MVSIIEKVLEKARELTWNNLNIPNSFAKNVFYLLRDGEITDTEYEQIFDEIQRCFPEEVRKHVGQRMDVRSLGKFALHIRRDADKALVKFKEWWKKYGSKHYPGQIWKRNGIEAAGVLVFSASRKEFKEPDFITSSGIKLELKLDPRNDKFTYKEADVQYYSSIGAEMLTLCPKLYTIATPEQQQEMLKTEVTKRWELGGKRCIQFYHNLTEMKRKEMVTKNNLSATAKPMDNFATIHLID